MPRKKKTEVITVAKPHTIKKFELIESYVDEWARKILGYEGNPVYGKPKGVIFIDCMCNSGMYFDVNGSLVEGTPLRVAKRLNEVITNYPGKKAILIFNDLEEARVQKLREEIEKAQLENIEVSYNCGDCNAFLRGLDLTQYSNSYNTLLLYDPYKAEIDWDAIKPFLNRWGEVIINHMASDTSRGASQAKKPQVKERYAETYQVDFDSLLEVDRDALDDMVVAIIRNNVHQSPDKYYVSLAPFHNRSNGKVYSLVHCSANVKGIILYKKVTWQTFGGKSSMKTTHSIPGQLMFSEDMQGSLELQTDDQCFTIADIAKYVYTKYAPLGTVDLATIYKDLDEHPVFPSEGFKPQIKEALKNIYNVHFPRGGNVVFRK